MTIIRILGYILALDILTEDTFRKLKTIDEKYLKVLTIEDLISYYPVLDVIRRERTHKEFCWTLSAFSTQYVMYVFGTPDIIYVDSDIFFFSDPRILLEEIINESVLITEHNYTPEYDQTNSSGKFCVQFMYFKNDESGRNVLEYWRGKCEEGCTSEIGKKSFGDQMYLNDWESRFEGVVYNCRNIGCGVAPWNLQKYEVNQENGNIFITDRISRLKRPLVFFHFHQLTRVNENTWYVGAYKTGIDFKEIVYREYIERLRIIERSIDEECVNDDLKLDKVKLLRFTPVPYLGEQRIEIKQIYSRKDITDNDALVYYDNTSNYQKCCEITIKDNDEKIYIFYRKSLYQGQWIIIDEITGKRLFAGYLHEIIWSIQYLECFSDCKTLEEMICEITERRARGERVMLECNAELLQKVKIIHPDYRRVQVVRVCTEIISKEGTVIYKELPKYEERIITITP